MRYLLLLVLFIIALPVQAADYNYYFADDGSGSTCSEAAPCATITDVQTKIDSLSSTDTVGIYFEAGSEWTKNTAAIGFIGAWIKVEDTDPEVHFDSYGTGEQPILNGLVTDFSSAPEHSADGSTGPAKWNRVFEIQKEDCSVSNLEIKNVYGHAIYLNDYLGTSDGFLLTNNLIHDFGSCAITTQAGHGSSDNEVRYNTIHTGQQLMRYNLAGGGWSGAVVFASKQNDDDSFGEDNWVHHNTIYDIFGEGIINPNSIIEYNLIGDTGSFAIGSDPRDFDVTHGIIRYNLVVFSDWDTSDYTGAPAVSGGSSVGTPVCVRFFDDYVGGDNSSGIVEIHGNVCINRDVGVWVFQSEDPGNPLGEIKVYDNVVIDSRKQNYRFYQPEEFNIGSIYNNSSIRINTDFTSYDHDQYANGTWPDAGWTAGENHFYPNSNINNDQGGTTDVTDPDLAGGVTDFTSLDGTPYYTTVDPATHLAPGVTSFLYDINHIIDMDIADIGATGTATTPETPETPAVFDGGKALLMAKLFGVYIR